MTRSGSLVLLLSVFLVAVASLIYELIAGAVSSYLLGNSIAQFSIVIGIFLTAMGLGSFLSKYIENNLLPRFIQVEVAIGLVGGFSASILFLCFAYTEIYFTALVTVSGIVGTFIGLEIPLIIRILREREGSLRITVSNVMTVDYIGALVASLAFPFLLVPHLGLLRASFLVGLLNIGVAWLGLGYFREESKKIRSLPAFAFVATLLVAGGLLFSSALVDFFEERIYPDEIIYAKQTKYQRIVITKWREDVRLFIDGKLQFSTKDEYRYHESLVHPAMSAREKAEDILVLGGGDGMAAREILKYPRVKSIDLVDIDPEMTRLFREKEMLARLSDYALRDPKVNVINRDAMRFLQENGKSYDVILMDLPDPGDLTLGKLYTKSFYTFAGKRLGPRGIICVQSSSPFFAPMAFWCIVNTLDTTPVAPGPARTFFVRPYHANVPSFGEWGFTLASPFPIDLGMLEVKVETQFIDNELMKSMFKFPPDMDHRETKINRLDNQILVEYYISGYKEFND